MTNLIKNSKWNSGPCGGPMFFSRTEPITFDEFEMNGYRSCSITMGDINIAKDAYDLFIDVNNANVIRFGMYIRAIDLTYISYVMEFFDENEYIIDTQVKDQTTKITYKFKDVFCNFKVPSNAAYAKVYWEFKDKVTACTYLAPQAYII